MDTKDTAAPARLRIRVWDLPTRVVHWALVAAVATAVITGNLGGAWMVLHQAAGLAVAGLVVFRIVWGFVGSTHARFASFVPGPATLVAYWRGRWRGLGHNPLGALSVLGLLALLGAQVGTGLFSNNDIDFAGPWAVQVPDVWSTRLTGLHLRLANALYILVGLHVLAIVWHAVVKKDNLVKPMWTGDKEADAGEPARPVGWPVFALALGSALAAVVIVSGAGGPAMAPAPPQAVKEAKPGW
ncbi:MAG TPA: cytochrome b/b6 domain-containing protein [Burkholderiaceae bacterium]|nr:cytochrome b/b6 domain-containing protein [Burkholderiaceae bacterium]